MARKIMQDVSRKEVSNRAGGVTRARDVLSYAMPKGPTSIGNRAVGLGGKNHGPCGTQGCYSIKESSSGRPGLGGTNRGNRGSQQ